MQVVRGEREARNKWVLLASPIDPSEPAKRMSERCTARLQVIPDAAFDQYGDRKIAGFTIAEIKEVYDTGEPKVIRRRDGVVECKLIVGTDPGKGEWPRRELGRIIEQIEESGVLLTTAPMAVDERQQEALKRIMEEGTKNDLIDALVEKGVGAKSTLAKKNKGELRDALESTLTDVEPAGVGE